MVERSPRGPCCSGRALLPLLIGLAFAPASRAEVRITPSVALTQTWTDNVSLQPANQAKSEFITEIVPGLSIVENSPRLHLAASYQFHEYEYSDKDAPNLRNNGRELNASLKATAIEDLLFLDAGAQRSLQSVSAFGPGLADNGYSTNNRTEVSTWQVSPYLARRIGTSANLLVRYTRDGVDTGRVGYGNTQGGDASVLLSSIGEQRLGWNLRYDRQELNDKLAGDSSSTSAQAGLSWRVQPDFALTGSAGRDDYDYHSLGGRTSGNSWNVGFAYNPSTRTSVTAGFGHRYFGASRNLLATHRSRHTFWNISYDNAVTTTRQQFLLPASVDTATLLDRLFTSNFPDPLQRQQAVNAYLQASGLPATLANDVNYLSNRYLLQKQFVATAGFTGVRSVLLVSVSDLRRNALSVQQSDSQLLGSSLLSLNDNTRQNGVSANLDYHLSSRTDAVWMVDASRARSPDTGISQKTRGIRLGLHHQFERKLQGALELRRLQGSASGSSQNYTENAISATLSMTL